MTNNSTRSARLSKLTDRFGATASFLCAIHCAMLPFVLALLPAMGLAFLASHTFERVFVAFAVVLALASLITGWRRHQRFHALWILLPGIVLLLVGVVHAVGTGLMHTVLLGLGGTLVATAHLVNLRLAHPHVHGPSCRH